MGRQRSTRSVAVHRYILERHPYGSTVFTTGLPQLFEPKDVVKTLSTIWPLQSAPRECKVLLRLPFAMSQTSTHNAAPVFSCPTTDSTPPVDTSRRSSCSGGLSTLYPAIALEVYLPTTASRVAQLPAQLAQWSQPLRTEAPTPSATPAHSSDHKAQCIHPTARRLSGSLLARSADSGSSLFEARESAPSAANDLRTR